MRVLYPNDLWSGRLIAKEFQKNFDPAVGFRQRADNREYGARLKFAPRPRNSRIVRQAGAEVWLDWFSDTRGRWTDKNDQYISTSISSQATGPASPSTSSTRTSRSLSASPPA